MYSDITNAVLKYRQTRKEIDFLPIWKHFEPKIKSMVHMKNQRLPLDYCILYEYMVDGLLLAIEKYDQTKSEFTTYFYQRVNGKISGLMKKINCSKRRGQLLTESLNVLSESGQEFEMQISDPHAMTIMNDTHVILSNVTLNKIIGKC